MWRDFDDWEDFPVELAAGCRRSIAHPMVEAVNRYAERFLAVIMAGAPFFYVALLLAYLAVSFGIIS